MKIPSLKQKTITCTDCFEIFAHHEVVFRCQCGKGLAGEQRLLGGIQAPKCDDCGKIATKIECPGCKSELPAGALSSDNKIVAILGAPGAGKSHYITTLYQQMREVVGPRQRLSMMIMDESSRRFSDRYYDPLYTHHRVIDRTVRVGLDSKTSAPLKFEVARSLSDSKSQILNMSFFDTAGEDLGDPDIMERELRYIANADAMVFILDPLQLEPIRNLLGPRGTILPGMDASAQPSLISRRVHDILLSEGRVKAGKKITVPVAFVLSKIDELFPLVDPGSPLRQPGLHTSGLNQGEIDSVHTEIISYLGEWGASLKNDIDIYYQNYRFFGVSSLGQPHGKDLTVGNISPIRVEDPMLWILNKFKMVDQM